MKCTLSWAVALAAVMSAATSNAALISSSVDITAPVNAGNPTIATPYQWSDAVGTNPTISMISGAGGANSLQNVPLVSDGAEIMAFSFKAVGTKLDKVAWAIINGVPTGATYTLRLMNFGTADPNVAYGVAGTDLFNGGAGLTYVHPGTANPQIVILDMTGTDEVSLTPGNTYVFEAVHATGTGGITFTRTGGGNSTYADGQYWKDRTGASSAGSRDAVAAVYTIPEPSSLGIASLAILGLLAHRRRV